MTQQAWVRRGWATIWPGLGHDTAEHAPQYGAQCARYSQARARVAWLAESVAIQRLYRGLGRHLCRNRCDAPKPGSPLTTRQLAEYKWMSGYPMPLQKIGQSLLCTGSSTQIQYLYKPVPNSPIYHHMSKTATWAHKQYS